MNMPHGKSIPVLYASGTHYEVGYQAGRTFKDRITAYYFEFEDLHTKFLPFYCTELGKKICGAYLNSVMESCPQYVEEMRGIADGSGVSFDKVFLMHIRVELQTYLEAKIVSECTTVLVNNKDQWLLAHNEDTSDAAFNRGYILVATIRESEPQGKHSIDQETFLAFCYPGIIPGNCFSCNSYGLILSVNALYACGNIGNGKTPRQFINRGMLAAKDPEHLIEILTDKGHGIATGCSVNVAFLPESSNRTMSNIELCPQPNVQETMLDKVDITFDTTTHSSIAQYSEHYVHFNMYQHMAVPQMEGRTTSSEHRKKRADALPPPSNLESALNILGDDEDKEYPIYRQPRPTDTGCTVVTGVFDLINHKILVYMGNPKSNSPVIEQTLPWNASS